MARMKNCCSVDGGLADLAIRGVSRCTGLAYSRANQGLYLLKQANSHQMRLWATQKGERVFGRRSYSLFYCLLRDVLMPWIPECANTRHTPVSRTPWKAVSREAETWKLRTEITGFSLDGTMLGPVAFRCMSGRQHGQATERLSSITMGWITLASIASVVTVL